VIAPAANIPVAVGEDTTAGSIAPCQALHGASCFGQGSFLTVGALGALFPDGFAVTIGYNSSHSNANFLHAFDLGGSEDITDDCTFDVGEVVPNNMPCKIIDTAQGKTFVTLWLTQNGKIYGY